MQDKLNNDLFSFFMKYVQYTALLSFGLSSVCHEGGGRYESDSETSG